MVGEVLKNDNYNKHYSKNTQNEQGAKTEKELEITLEMNKLETRIESALVLINQLECKINLILSTKKNSTESDETPKTTNESVLGRWLHDQNNHIETINTSLMDMLERVRF